MDAPMNLQIEQQDRHETSARHMLNLAALRRLFVLRRPATQRQSRTAADVSGC